MRKAKSVSILQNSSYSSLFITDLYVYKNDPVLHLNNPVLAFKKVI